MRTWVDRVNTLLLALVLAVLVWLIAINQENPLQERNLTGQIPVALTNLEAGLVLMRPSQANASVSVRAPRQTLDALRLDDVALTLDLAGLGSGTWDVPITGAMRQSNARLTRIEPSTVQVTLERELTRTLPVRLEMTGMPAPGYELGETRLDPALVTLVGPTSLVERVSAAVVTVNMLNSKTSFNGSLTVRLLDSALQTINGVTLNATRVDVTVPVTQKVGFRDVAVKVILTGQAAPGYRITNITVSPPIVTLSSSDPQQVQSLPGVVETLPIDLNSADSDVLVRRSLTLPAGINLVGEPTVFVQISIEPIEGSVQLERPIEWLNLGLGLTATISPASVNVLLTGPLPVLDQLNPDDIRLTVDLADLPEGVYTLAPRAVLFSDALRAENILPNLVEVVLSRRPTPAPETPTPALTPTPNR